MTLIGSPANGTFTTTATAGFTDNGNGTATLDPSMMPIGGPYDVTYTFTDANGCSNSVTQQVTISQVLVVNFGGLDSVYCEDAGIIQLTGSPANSNGTFTINTTSGLTDNGNGTATLDISLIPTGQTFTITYSYIDNTTGQSGSQSHNFIVYANPVVNFTGLQTTFCANDSVDMFNVTPLGGTMTASPNATGAITFNGSTYTFDPSVYPLGSTVTLTYTTTVNGCTGSSSQTVVIHPLPVATISGLSSAYCADAPAFTITGNPNSNSPAGSFTTTLSTGFTDNGNCLLYTSPSPRDATLSRMPSSA